VLCFCPNLFTAPGGSTPPTFNLTLPAGSQSYTWSVWGYFGGGSVTIAIELSNDPSFAAPQIAFQGPVTIIPNYRENRVLVSVMQGATQFCQYGTELQPTGQLVYYLTPALIDAWLVAVGMPWLGAIFTALYFTSFNAQTLCQQGPPTLPTIDLSTLQASAQTLTGILRAIAWPNLCQCAPGAPAPIPYPPPTATEPTGWPTFPTYIVTTPGDPAALQDIQNRLAQLQQALSLDYQLGTLEQRWKLPFGYIKSRVHTQLSGQGSFGISRLLGLIIDVTTEPPGKVHLLGNPDYIKDLGWISVSSPDGMLQEHRIAQTHYEWFPCQMQLASLVGWEVQAGVVITITEVVPEA
jgi:hypothetical protein